MNGHFLTVKEWAEKNKLTEATVLGWCEDGFIDGVEKFGVEWAIPYSAPVPVPHFGKEQCILLKKVRKKIAEENGIEFEPKRCNHRGVCPGTCSVCDAELAYLESELKKKVKKGKRIIVNDMVIDEIIAFKNRIIEETDRFKELNENIEHEVAELGGYSYGDPYKEEKYLLDDEEYALEDEEYVEEYVVEENEDFF